MRYLLSWLARRCIYHEQVQQNMDVLRRNVHLPTIQASSHFPAGAHCHSISHFYRIAEPWLKLHLLCQRRQHAFAGNLNDRDHQSDRIRLASLTTSPSRIELYPQLGLVGRWILGENQKLQIRNQPSLPYDEASPNQHINREGRAILPDTMQHIVRMHLPQQKSNIPSRNFNSHIILEVTIVFMP